MKTKLAQSMKRIFKVLGVIAITASLNSCLKNSAKPILQVPDTPSSQIGTNNGTANPIVPGTNSGSNGSDLDIQPLPGQNQTQPPITPINPITPIDPQGSNNSSLSNWDGLSHDIGSGLTIE